MGYLSVMFLLFKETIMFKKSVYKIKPQSPMKKVDTYRTPVYAPDYIATFLAAKISTNTHVHTI